MADPARIPAIVGVYSAPYARDSGRDLTAMILEACVGAIRDAGLTASDIDGISGSVQVMANEVQHALRIPSISWWSNTRIPIHNQLIAACNAVIAGACSNVLVYHGLYRSLGTSRAARSDPFRRRFGTGANTPDANPDSMLKAAAYAPWTDHYLTRAGADRQVLAQIAVNSRTHAVDNEHAAIRVPLTFDEYHAAPLIRSPLCAFDMDLPVDGADAFVVTTLDRARDLATSPVVMHAYSMGMTSATREDQMPDLEASGHMIAAREMWRRAGDLTLDDVDLVMAYDGFSVIAARWLEVLGFCAPYEAGSLIDSSWNDDRQRIELDGRVLINTHGGSLSDGGTQGCGHFREAVLQLRSVDGTRQTSPVDVALLGVGGFFHNAAAAVLRRDDI